MTLKPSAWCFPAAPLWPSDDQTSLDAWVEFFYGVTGRFVHLREAPRCRGPESLAQVFEFVWTYEMVMFSFYVCWCSLSFSYLLVLTIALFHVCSLFHVQSVFVSSVFCLQLLLLRSAWSLCILSFCLYDVSFPWPIVKFRCISLYFSVCYFLFYFDSLLSSGIFFLLSLSR